MKVAFTRLMALSVLAFPLTVLSQEHVSLEFQELESPIVLPDDGWYQIQTNSTRSSGVTVCEGVRSCDLSPGFYMVINHTVGTRRPVSVISSTSDPIQVRGNTISWTNDPGWHQVQSPVDYSTACESSTSCVVNDGLYVVINHTTGVRHENIRVGYPSGDSGTVEVAASVTVEGNVINWPLDGWYQVQNSIDYTSVCEGGASCEVSAGTYIVINHTTGERFEAITVGDTGSTPIPVDEPIEQTAAELTLENVLRIINTNAHDRVKFGLVDFDSLMDMSAPGLTLRDTTTDIAGTPERLFDCNEGGTLGVAQFESFGQRVNTIVDFDDCTLDDTIRNGVVAISKGPDEDPSINMSYSEYQETQIATDPRDNVVVDIPNGTFAKRENWGDNYSREFMATPLLYTVTTRAGVEKLRDLKRTNSYYREGEDPLAAVEFEASFIVDSFWTSDHLISVTSPTELSNPDSVTGFYQTGKLTMVEKTTFANAGRERATGYSIELDASTGDANTYLFTVTDGDAVVSELRNWADLPETLPCPISAFGVALEEVCR